MTGHTLTERHPFLLRLFCLIRCASRVVADAVGGDGEGRSRGTRLTLVGAGAVFSLLAADERQTVEATIIRGGSELGMCVWFEAVAMQKW